MSSEVTDVSHNLLSIKKEPDIIDIADIKVETESEPLQEEGNFPNSFCCILCLRKCDSEMLLEFNSHIELNFIDTGEAEEKVHQALGLRLKLDHRAICLTCWKLIDLITDFKDCCVKATSMLEEFPMGLVTKQDWTSEDSQNGIDQYRNLIWEHAELIDAEQEKAASESIDVDIKPVIFEQSSVSAEDSNIDGQDSIQIKNFAMDIDELPANAQGVGTKDPIQNQPNSTTLKINGAKEDYHQMQIYTCPVCQANFDSAYAINGHRTRCTPDAPSNIKYISCPICTASFSQQTQKTRLANHMNKHNGIRPFKCRKMCHKRFASNIARGYHERKCCVQNCFCEDCGAQLENEAALENHFQYVHGDGKYACEDCGKMFHNKKIYENHKLRVHFEQRIYNCDMCGKGFKTYNTLVTHQRAHTPYVCHVCYQSFSYKVLLKTHIEENHDPRDEKLKAVSCSKN